MKRRPVPALPSRRSLNHGSGVSVPAVVKLVVHGPLLRDRVVVAVTVGVAVVVVVTVAVVVVVADLVVGVAVER